MSEFLFMNYSHFTSHLYRKSICCHSPHSETWWRCLWSNHKVAMTQGWRLRWTVLSCRPWYSLITHQWTPCLTKQQSDLLQSIEWRAMKIALHNLTYESALSEAKLTTIKKRHVHLCKRLFTHMKNEKHKLHLSSCCQR